MKIPGSRGRLFRKYVVVLLVLVGGVLMASSLVELYFSYRETQRAIVRVERAKAVAAAAGIEQFLKEVEQQVRETTRTASDDPDASQVGQGRLGFRQGLRAALADQRELDFLRVLRNVSAVSELSHLDLAGKEQLRVSRLDPDVVGSQEDFSQAPKFVEGKAGKTYWSPVYFRNESEPYVTLAVPVGKYAVEVTTAEVSLGAVLKMVSQIEVGPGGYAYVVDSRNHLVAHPDSRMLREKRDLSALVQVESARADRSAPTAEAPVAMVADGLSGGRVLAAHAAIAPVGWLVFVERPAADAYAPLRAPIIRSAGIFVLGLGLSILASLVLARRMVAPIRLLQEGAARIGAGDLGHRIEVRTGDELEALGDELNRTARQLEESYANLEHKVEERTRELVEANRDLTEALEQLTATSEILRVISSSPTDVQPVFDAIAVSAARLCESVFVAVYRFDGELIDFVAHHGMGPEGLAAMRRSFPRRLDRRLMGSRAILDRLPVHIPDVAQDPELQQQGVVTAIGVKSAMSVPMLREGVPIGAIAVGRARAGPFSERQIVLLKTFADQAVIAIENVRLFQELQARTGDLARSVEELKALGEVGRAVSSTLDLPTVLATIVTRAVELSGTSGGAVFEYDEATQEFRLRATHRMEDELVEALRAAPVRLGEGTSGRAAVTRAPVQVTDLLDEGQYPLTRIRSILARLGYRSILAVPLLLEQQIMGSLTVHRREEGSFAPEIVNLMQAFATQSVLAIQNARLFREIEAKSRQLEVASRHKSDFLSNVSHELRTPLNAILGFNEMILGQVYGEVPPDLKEPLTDIQNSGKHLLRLINNVLDLAKIEAGRMELALADYSVQDTVESVRASLRPLAADKGLEFVAAVPVDIPLAYGDAGRITQCLMNLAGNALKFTRQGRVEISVELQGDLLVYRVADTGIGIPKDKIETVFSEFGQGDATIASEFGGTGLGLSITKKFVEMHRGRIWVESEMGKGSTFFFAVPLRLHGGNAA